MVALRLFYRDYLGKKWALWERFEIRRNRPLPVVLTRGETRRLLGSVRSGRSRAVLALIYHCGLRVGEAVALRPGHIKAHPQSLGYARMMPSSLVQDCGMA